MFHNPEKDIQSALKEISKKTSTKTNNKEKIITMKNPDQELLKERLNILSIKLNELAPEINQDTHDIIIEAASNDIDTILENSNNGELFLQQAIQFIIKNSDKVEKISELKNDLIDIINNLNQTQLKEAA